MDAACQRENQACGQWAGFCSGGGRGARERLMGFSFCCSTVQLVPWEEATSGRRSHGGKGLTGQPASPPSLVTTFSKHSLWSLAEEKMTLRGGALAACFAVLDGMRAVLASAKGHALTCWLQRGGKALGSQEKPSWGVKESHAVQTNACCWSLLFNLSKELELLLMDFSPHLAVKGKRNCSDGYTQQR